MATRGMVREPSAMLGPARHGLFEFTGLGWGLALPVFLLSLLGLFCIHATDRLGAAGASGETEWIFAEWAAVLGPATVRQLAFILTGVGLMIVTLLPSYTRIGKHAYLFYGLVMAALVALIIDRYVWDVPDWLIPVRRNTRRWLTLGSYFSIQPSEFMKLGLILALARYLRYRDSYRTWAGLVPPFLFTVAPMLLILKQPDLGTLLMLLPVLFCMLFVAGARKRHLVTVILAGAALLPAFYAWGMSDYQRDRIRVVFMQSSPDERWHMDKGYQLRQAKIALALGGLTGEGYGRGLFLEANTQLLPEENNDFIFAIIGHQFGLIGCLVLISLYAVIVICGVEIATKTNDPFGRLLAVGVIVMIVLQALLNVCENIGMAPITGITLPFVSAGGSSVWANFIALGLLVNVAQRRPMMMMRKPFEHRDG
ncbi:MAG: FtsW/RodA/SpoVE family cell cycle protein [Phycisphaerae bacterium]|nr:FtsW/RodA/SpoVE family cell cycle protein [Phycisphaerae bacterium]